ncbi:hypothetical protein Bca4012_092492 [Brassica carinata]
MFGLPIVQETMIKLETIQTNMKKAQDRQKKYTDQSRREVTFAIGDWVYLKVTAQKGNDKFDKVGKLAVRFIGPYKIIGKVSEDLEAKPTIVVTLGYVTHVISRNIFQGFVPKTSGITNGVTSTVIHRSGWKMSLVSLAV